MPKEELYFIKTTLPNNPSKATPLKIKIGEYSVVIGGNDSIGRDKQRIANVNLAVFKLNNPNAIEKIYSPTVDDILKTIEKYRRISKKENLNEKIS